MSPSQKQKESIITSSYTVSNWQLFFFYQYQIGNCYSPHLALFDFFFFEVRETFLSWHGSLWKENKEGLKNCSLVHFFGQSDKKKKQTAVENEK